MTPHIAVAEFSGTFMQAASPAARVGNCNLHTTSEGLTCIAYPLCSPSIRRGAGGDDLAHSTPALASTRKRSRLLTPGERICWRAYTPRLLRCKKRAIGQALAKGLRPCGYSPTMGNLRFIWA
jgi:hypothetical protein